MTEKQQEIFDFIVRYIRENLYPPTVREIGDGVGLKSTSSVFAHLRTMAKKGTLRCRREAAHGQSEYRDIDLLRRQHDNSE